MIGTLERAPVPPVDFRFLDLFLILVLCLGGFGVVAVVMGIGGALAAQLEIASTMVPDAGLTRPYAFEFVARGGRAPYRWSFEKLPPGLDNTREGIIKGEARAIGTYAVLVHLEDARGTIVSKSTTIDVVDYGHYAPLRIRTESLPVGRVSEPLRVALSAEGGALPYTWTAEGLPAGVDVKDGTVVGAPTAAGLYQAVLRLRDSADQSASREITVQVLQGRLGDAIVLDEPLAVSTVMPPVVAGEPYSLQLVATGGSPPYQWQLTSRYPSTRVSLQGVLSSDDTSNWVRGSALTVRVFDRTGRTAEGTLSPRVVGQPGWLVRTLLVIAALGSWVLAMLLVRQAAQRPAALTASRLVGQPAAFLALAFLLLSTVSAFSTYLGTVLFAALVSGVAVFCVTRR
jgi:hypothetical protein